MGASHLLPLPYSCSSTSSSGGWISPCLERSRSRSTCRGTYFCWPRAWPRTCWPGNASFGGAFGGGMAAPQAGTRGCAAQHSAQL